VKTAACSHYQQKGKVIYYVCQTVTTKFHTTRPVMLIDRWTRVTSTSMHGLVKIVPQGTNELLHGREGRLIITHQCGD
jgi:hypothetical protein